MGGREVSIRWADRTEDDLLGIKEALNYNPESGVFTWKVNRSNKMAGSIAGCLGRKGGYVKITYNNKNYAAHRLAWFFIFGSFPNSYIDHIDNDPENNKLSNLRIATNAQNQQNAKTRKDSKSGYKGVFFSKRRNKWMARIRLSRFVQKDIGLYDNPEAAHIAYCEAAKLYFGEYANYGH